VQIVYILPLLKVLPSYSVRVSVRQGVNAIDSIRVEVVVVVTGVGGGSSSLSSSLPFSIVNNSQYISLSQE
jgi:hypothetical protein